jgi:hypothetical protein
MPDQGNAPEKTAGDKDPFDAIDELDKIVR